MRYIIIFILLYLNLFAFIIDRRSDKKAYNSYYIFPTPIDIPGVGSGIGVGLALGNIGKTDMDFVGSHIEGDFKLDIATLLNIPIYLDKNYHITLSPAYFHFKNGGAEFYERGRDSKKDERYFFGVDQYNVDGVELAIKTPDEQLEAYFGAAHSHLEPNIIRDPQGNNVLSNVGTIDSIIYRYGLYLDDTDHRRDPRVGYRIQAERVGILQDNKKFGDGYTDDISITAFLPIPDHNNVLVMNYFRSKAVITREGEVNDNDYICNPNSISCNQTMLDELKKRRQADVKKGNSTSLGGTQRLRAYPANRFYDVYSAFYGFEYRMYLLNHWKPFNAFLWKGVNTGLQLALFREYGQVSEHDDGSLYDDMKTSTGIGLRVLFSNVVFRVDAATGNEGEQVTVYYGYSF